MLIINSKRFSFNCLIILVKSLSDLLILIVFSEFTVLMIRVCGLYPDVHLRPSLSDWPKWNTGFSARERHRKKYVYHTPKIWHFFFFSYYNAKELWGSKIISHFDPFEVELFPTSIVTKYNYFPFRSLWRRRIFPFNRYEVELSPISIIGSKTSRILLNKVLRFECGKFQ